MDTRMWGYGIVFPLLSPPLVTAWKRQKVPIVAACGITPLVITPPAARGVC